MENTWSLVCLAGNLSIGLPAEYMLLALANVPDTMEGSLLWEGVEQLSPTRCRLIVLGRRDSGRRGFLSWLEPIPGLTPVKYSLEEKDAATLTILSGNFLNKYHYFDFCSRSLTLCNVIPKVRLLSLMETKTDIWKYRSLSKVKAHYPVTYHPDKLRLSGKSSKTILTRRALSNVQSVPRKAVVLIHIILANFHWYISTQDIKT